MEEYAGIALIPLIVGLSELIKQAGFPVKYIPICNLVFGLIAGIILTAPGDIKTGIVQGIYMGLGASGLFSATKNVIQGFKQK